MPATITPHLIELTYEAALKSYWRKKALRSFLRASKVSDRFLATWAADESKREFLDRAFIELQKTDAGKMAITQMARSLSEQIAFPDLRNWEDSDQKIAEAKIAVEELRTYLNYQDEEIRTQREREELKQTARQQKTKIQRALSDIEKLRTRFESLYLQVGTQSGGYEFQNWFYDFLDFYEIRNRRPYVSDGRQIDGSLTHEGTTYLVELKFTANQADATDIDSLRAKVQDKADNTMGIMVSISGFSNIAVGGASGRRGVLLLMDYQHLYLCLTGGMDFGDVISRIRRHASQTGQAFLEAAKFGG